MSSAIAKRKREENGESLLKDEVEFSRLDTPFPRGGGSELAPLEIKQAAADATNDIFDQMVKSKKQKKTRSKTSALPVPPSSRIEPFLFGKIKVGTLTLGQITDVNYNTSELVVSLPNNLTGYCPSAVLNREQIGRFLRFAVTDIGEAPKRRLLVSADPEYVNQSIDANELTNGLAVQGLIESIEEKGLLLNLGTSLGQGFLMLPAKQIPNYELGEPVMAFIKDSEKRIKPLTIDTNVSVATVLSQPSLVPGTLVKSAPVDKTTTMGCTYDLLGHIHASSDAIHSRGENSSVRVLFSYPPTHINGDRILGVSRTDSVLKLGITSINELKTGKVVNGTVTSVMPNLGLLLTFKINGDETVAGFAHISQIEGDNEVSLDENAKYAVGTEHTARVTGVSSLDNVAYISLDESVIKQKYMSISDVRTGDVISDAVIDRILPKGGILVRISKGVVGIASEYQLSDAALRNPELKYKVGQRVQARVLNVMLERERIELTLKKSLIEFDGPIIASYESLNGKETLGSVIRVLDKGVKVLFFGGIRGFLPVGEMSETGAKPEELVRVGQTIKVHVLEADLSRDRLLVSMRPRSELAGHIGEVLPATVSNRNKHEVRVNVLPDLGEATLVGNGADDSGKKLKVNDQIRVKVLTDRLVTNNALLLDAELPESVDDLEIGKRLAGFVSGVQPEIGVFVGFAAGLTGLIPANVLGQARWPVVGKAVNVVVDTVDFARKRVFLSLPSAARTVNATISAVKATQLNVVTEDGQQGRVDISQVFNSVDDIEDPKHPLKSFHTGQKLEGLFVVGRHDARNHRFLPLSHRTGTNVVLELARHQTFDTPVGSKVLAFVNNYSDDGRSLWVTLTPTTRGQMSLVDLSADLEILNNPGEFYPVGAALEVTVLKSGPKVSLTALTEPSNLAMVFSVDPLRLMVRLPYHKTAAVNCVDTGDEYSKLQTTFHPGDIVQFKREAGSRVTLRTDPHEPVREGDVRKGYVSNIASGGVFVSLAPNVVGRVQIGQLSDNYLKNWKDYVHVGDVVDAKVLSVSPSGKIELSLKPSTVTGRKQQNLDKIEVGKNYNGVVRRVESFGVFVGFKGVTGLCHKSEISDNAIDDLSRVFQTGDNVRVKVLAKDEAAGRLSLGMKAKYFEDDAEASEVESEDEQMEEDVAASEASDFASFGDEDVDVSSDSDSQEEEEDIEISRMSSDSEDSSDSETEDSGRTLSAGFNWSGDIPEHAEDNSESGSDDSDSDDEPRKRRRRKRDEFVRDETASLQTRLPQSAKDFERLLVATPNSSVLWMNYMAFQLQLGEIDGAREIGRRALKTISRHEEEERLNIWVALLNLEAQFGTADSTENTFKEAQQYMDSLTIHLRMATVFAQAGKLSEAASIYKRAHKRFGGEAMEPWLAEIRFWFTTGGNMATGRALADQALQRLPNRLHRDFTRQFALLEFELGDAERGRTLFEALLASAPKRVDIWSVYIDQEIKQGNNEERINALFDRVLQQRISMKQAKFFFKKWIDVASDQEYVKMRAREYVENREKAAKNDGEEDDSDANMSDGNSESKSD